jgi:hypothetical protein
MPVMKPMLDFLAKTGPMRACSTLGPGGCAARRHGRRARQGGGRADGRALVRNSYGKE